MIYNKKRYLATYSLAGDILVMPKEVTPYIKVKGVIFSATPSGNIQFKNFIDTKKEYLHAAKLEIKNSIFKNRLLKVSKILIDCYNLIDNPISGDIKMEAFLVDLASVPMNEIRFDVKEFKAMIGFYFPEAVLKD